MYPPKDKTAVKPEPLSWVIWGFLTGTGAWVQIAQGGDVGSWCLVITSAACFGIAVWSYLKWRREWAFKTLHKFVTIAAIALFAISTFISENPALATWAVLIAAFTDFLSYFPTFAKGWLRPHEDSYENFFFNCVKCIPAYYALQSHTIATTAYLIMLFGVNGSFAMFLFLSQRQVSLWRVLNAHFRGGLDVATRILARRK